MSRPASSRTSITLSLLVPAGIGTATLRRWMQHAQRRLRVVGPVSVVVVSPAVSRRYNKKYRRRDRATNVLSFDYAHDGDVGEGGDIILCPTVIRREAKALGEAYRNRFKMLLEHGFIHLLGLDHQSDAQQRAWERQERKLL